MKPNNSKSGMALVTVMCFLFMTAALVAILMKSSLSHYIMADATVELEQAANIAEAGAERAVAHIANGGATPTTLSGTMGNGSYETTIMASDDDGNVFNGEHMLSGDVNLNPNNSPDNAFTMTLNNGTIINRDTLAKDYAGYNGTATYIHFKPKGNGNQNSLILDGSPYDLSNSETYDITAPSLNVSIYNDKVVNGNANGKWWLSVNGANANMTSTAGDLDTTPRAKSFSVTSVGTIGQVSRRVAMTGLRNMSWAKFALWSHDNRNIYFKSNEEFYGPVHANSKLWFSGDPHFFAEVTSSSDVYGGSIVNAIFDKGFQLEVPVDTMADIPFDDLLDEANLGGTENRVISEDCWVVLDGDDIKVGTEQTVIVTNMVWVKRKKRRQGYWKEITTTDTKIVYDTLENATEELIYVEGDMHIQGELDGRRTFVTEGDIYIDDSLTYASDPKLDNTSDDGLGLLSKKDIIVTEDCPDDLEIYAHMMATGEATTQTDNDGSFRVEDYNDGSPRGQLIVHGGIVQNYRGAVGTFSTRTGQTSTGFEKLYTYDERFSKNPPPHYPTLDDEYTFDDWQEGSP